MPAQAPCPVLPGPTGPADPGQRQEVLLASIATGAPSAARHFCQEGTADHQRLLGAGAEQRMAGGAVMPEIRQQPSVPFSAKSLGGGGLCGSLGGQSDSELVHPLQRPPQCDQTSGWQALFRLIRTNDQGEDRIKCRAPCPPLTTYVLMRASKLTSIT